MHKKEKKSSHSKTDNGGTTLLDRANDTHPQVTSPRKVFTVLVERHSHDSVSGIEGLLDTITVMNVNVNVENTLVVPES